MSYIHVYQGVPTSGGTDGVAVSEGGAQTNPIPFTLNATTSQVGTALKLAIRTDATYQTTSGVNTVISLTGTTAAKWALAPDSSGSPGTFGSYGASLTISTQIAPTNTNFWVKAQATTGETPQNDVSVSLQVVAQVEAI